MSFPQDRMCIHFYDKYIYDKNIHICNSENLRFNFFFYVGEQIRGVIIGTTLGYIQHCAFSLDDSLVAACNNNDVLILRSNVSWSCCFLKPLI